MACERAEPTVVSPEDKPINLPQLVTRTHGIESPRIAYHIN
jgi:hypothetical protein